jgi:hypothetical protein
MDAAIHIAGLVIVVGQHLIRLEIPVDASSRTENSRDKEK